jgi:hypothetical protein
MNGDGLPDVLAAAMYADDIVWYEAPHWTRHVVDSNLQGAYFLHVIDMDGDRDMDIVTDGTQADAVVWCENTFAVVNNETLGILPPFSLHQNYPNPSMASTKISFSVSHPELVTLTVYDVLGRPIRAVRDRYESAGTYEVTFEATGLPSGIYFYRLQAGDYVETRRMVIVR